jgi:hypothetical protein
MSSRHLFSDLEGRLDAVTLTEDESCFVLSNTARVATIKLLGSFSRNAYTEKGLNEREIHALEHLYQILQT